MTEKLKQFDGHQYLNLETYRRNGGGVKTPVWFARDGQTLHVWTQTDSGKARRIRRDGRVRLVPSTASGEPLGEWVDGRASTQDSPEAVKLVLNLMKKKYGAMFTLFYWLGRTRKAAYTTLKIDLH
jgi:PPOX class probable F420-dependent enzyme